MSCLNSFFFISLGNINVPVGTEFDQWGLPPQNYWAYESNAKESTFDIQGFKNISIHRIEAVGDVGSTVNSTPVIVNDWNFIIEVGGNNQLIGSKINTTVNDFGIATQAINPVISLSRWKSDINFPSPILSAKYIKIIKLQASGIGVENLSTINLKWNVNFVVYYSFEGEDE